MKTLQDYIVEKSQFNESEESKTLTFDFTDLENAEETLNSLKEMDGCKVEENKLTITITKDNVDSFGTVQDILQQYAETLRNSSKRSSDEKYAQKTKSFAEKVGEFNDALDEIGTDEEE